MGQSIAEKNPYKIIKELLKDIDLLSKDMIKSFTYLVENKSNSLEKINSNLHAFSPLAVLDRGYAIVQNASGQAIKNSHEVQEAELVSTRLSSGSFKSKISLARCSLLNAHKSSIEPPPLVIRIVSIMMVAVSI